MHGNDWRSWPADLQDPRDARRRPHPTGLDVLPLAAMAAGRAVRRSAARRPRGRHAAGIVHDLAVGVSPGGADAWAYPDVLATGLTVGAPPDDYSQLGQDWQQPPWRPDRLAELGYAPLRDLFRAALRHAGGLRIDHVIGLFRLWWIPAGQPATAGTYVHYDHEAIIGVLALEAHRAGAVIIGEDLGNVEPWVRTTWSSAASSARRSCGSRATEPPPAAAERWRRDCLASVTTHDLPPTTGYLAGEHVVLRDRLGLLTRPLAEEAADDNADEGAWSTHSSRPACSTARPPVTGTPWWSRCTASSPEPRPGCVVRR